MNWWNYIPQRINPNIIEIGSFYLRYYGLMYIIAFFITYLLAMHRLKTERYEYTKQDIREYFLWAILGVMIGGRLGFVLFYDLSFYLANPLKIISPLDFSDGVRYTGITGMSYHGGLLGVIGASVLFCRKKRIKFWAFADYLAPAIPLGYTFGRIGNFINGELYGRITSMPWGMYFPLDPAGQLRHPSQLYEAFFEGIFLFIILWSIRKKRLFDGFHFCLYIIGYGIVRFFIEFVREPNQELGYILNYFTMGQILCIAMTLAGISIIVINTRKSSVTTVK